MGALQLLQTGALTRHGRMVSGHQVPDWPDIIQPPINTVWSLGRRGCLPRWPPVPATAAVGSSTSLSRPRRCRLQAREASASLAAVSDGPQHIRDAARAEPVGGQPCGGVCPGGRAAWPAVCRRPGGGRRLASAGGALCWWRPGWADNPIAGCHAARAGGVEPGGRQRERGGRRRRRPAVRPRREQRLPGRLHQGECPRCAVPAPVAPKQKAAQAAAGRRPPCWTAAALRCPPAHPCDANPVPHPIPPGRCLLRLGLRRWWCGPT